MYKGFNPGQTPMEVTADNLQSGAQMAAVNRNKNLHKEVEVIDISDINEYLYRQYNTIDYVLIKMKDLSTFNVVYRKIGDYVEVRVFNDNLNPMCSFNYKCRDNIYLTTALINILDSYNQDKGCINKFNGMLASCDGVALNLTVNPTGGIGCGWISFQPIIIDDVQKDGTIHRKINIINPSKY